MVFTRKPKGSHDPSFEEPLWYVSLGSTCSEPVAFCKWQGVPSNVPFNRNWPSEILIPWWFSSSFPSFPFETCQDHPTRARFLQFFEDHISWQLKQSAESRTRFGWATTPDALAHRQHQSCPPVKTTPFTNQGIHLSFSSNLDILDPKFESPNPWLSLSPASNVNLWPFRRGVVPGTSGGGLRSRWANRKSRREKRPWH